MKLAARISALAILLLVGMRFTLPVRGDVLFVSPGAWTPFLERIDPQEFIILENSISESLSFTNDLVIYDTYYQPEAFSYALSRKSGAGYQLRITDVGPVGPSHKTLPLPTDIAERLIAVMEIALTHQVYAPTGKAVQVEASEGKRLSGDDESYVLVNLRLDSKRTLSGRIRRGNRNIRCLMGQGLESGYPFRELLYRMGQLGDQTQRYRFGGKNSVGYSPLFMLDLAISDLRLSYPADR